MKADEVHTALNKQAIINQQKGYLDPRTGFFVFSSHYLESRGACCSSGCMHCPYGDKK